MKQIALILLLLGIVGGLCAQQGLFDLSYGYSYEKANQVLNDDFYKYVETEHSPTYSCYYSQTNDYVDSIELFFNSELDQLVCWRITYHELEDDYILDAVLEAAVSIHGEDYALDEDYGTYIWDLGDGKSLYLGYDANWFPAAEYFNPDYAEYSSFF